MQLTNYRRFIELIQSKKQNTLYEPAQNVTIPVMKVRISLNFTNVCYSITTIKRHHLKIQANRKPTLIMQEQWKHYMKQQVPLTFSVDRKEHMLRMKREE